MRTVIVILACCLLAGTAGCESAAGRKIPLSEQVKILKEENSQLTHQIEQSRAEKKQLEEQIKTLSGLKSKSELGNLYDLQKVKITRYTNLYDKNKDGKKETLIVYIQPLDGEDDVIKANGEAEVQLWDLNKDNTPELLGEWHVGPNELKKLWFAAFVTINYRLSFDVGDKIDKASYPLTVKVTFTDYLTGKVFREQRVIRQ